MKDEFTDVIIEKNLHSLIDESIRDYIAHIYCDKGVCSVVFNEKTFVIKEKQCAIFTIPSFVTQVNNSNDFQCTIIYVSNQFIHLASPENNYGIKGGMLLFDNPVMSLNENNAKICKKDFLLVEARYKHRGHTFYIDQLIASLRLLFIDFFHFHSVLLQGKDDISDIQGSLISKFYALLLQGEFVKHREISYYADKLCVTKKYLSETVKKVSGYPALYWINRFTILEIQKYLRNSSLTIVEISEIFNFSSVSYFSRYVYKLLGQYPSYYRQK